VVKGRRFTDPATLKRQLESGEEVALIDVSSAEELRGSLGHIAGASNIPIAELSAKIRELTEIKRKPIITI
jgi:rhodanese-related sulfurtransferase